MAGCCEPCHTLISSAHVDNTGPVMRLCSYKRREGKAEGSSREVSPQSRRTPSIRAGLLHQGLDRPPDGKPAPSLLLPQEGRPMVHTEPVRYLGIGDIAELLDADPRTVTKWLIRYSNTPAHDAEISNVRGWLPGRESEWRDWHSKHDRRRRRVPEPRPLIDVLADTASCEKRRKET